MINVNANNSDNTNNSENIPRSILYERVDDNNVIEEVENDEFGNTFLDTSSQSSSSDSEFKEYYFSDTPYSNSSPKHYSEAPNTDDFSSRIKNFLRSWAIKHNVTASAVSDLLVGLKENVDNLTNILPSDARTLLKTNLILDKICIEPGYYIHFGLKTQLKYLVENSMLNNIHELHLLVNIDGLPIFKNSPGQVIPILVYCKYS